MFEALAVGFLGGLTSGIGMYLVRQKLRADSLRRAISMEIRKSTPVDSFKASILGADSLDIPIIEANLDKIHLLSKQEVAMIARYHAQMAKVRWYNKKTSTDDRVSISRDLANNTSEVAKQAVETLEGNIWKRPKPIQWVRNRIRNQKREPQFTEKELEEKRERLRQRGEQAYEKE
jgi:hypothetical protein